MVKKYGFKVEKYDCGNSIEILTTGDGKAQFTDIRWTDGTAGIGMAYGMGEGLGTTKKYDDGTLATEVNIKWIVKFESQKSIDAMIETLLRVKNSLQ